VCDAFLTNCLISVLSCHLCPCSNRTRIKQLCQWQTSIWRKMRWQQIYSGNTVWSQEKSLLPDIRAAPRSLGRDSKRRCETYWNIVQRTIPLLSDWRLPSPRHQTCQDTPSFNPNQPAFERKWACWTPRWVFCGETHWWHVARDCRFVQYVSAFAPTRSERNIVIATLSDLFNWEYVHWYEQWTNKDVVQKWPLVPDL
jgi:hypothetical protein